MTTFGRIARSGVVAVAEAHKPRTDQGLFVLDKLKAVARQLRHGFERITEEGYVSEAAKQQAAQRHVADTLKAVQRVGNEVARLNAESEQAMGKLHGEVDRLERQVTMVAARRLERIGNQLRSLKGPELQRALTEAAVRRDPDVLLAAHAEGLHGSREALENYLVGQPEAEHARALAREALALQQAHQLLALGVETMNVKPHEWIDNRSLARPEEVLSVLSGGPAAFIEVRRATQEMEARWADAPTQGEPLQGQQSDDSSKGVIGRGES